MDKKYKLERPFDIDDGQLDGLAPQEIFVLGYELCMIDQLIDRGEQVDRMVHAANRDRIKWAFDKVGRECTFGWHSDDASEGWLHLMAPL